MFTLILTLINTFLIFLLGYYLINRSCEKCGKKRKLILVWQDFFKPTDLCLQCQKPKSQLEL